MDEDTPKRPPDAGRRGPVRRHPPRRPTGYRTDDETRMQLEVASSLFGAGSLQGVIDRAIEAYLRSLRSDPDFLQAVTAARQRRAP